MSCPSRSPALVLLSVLLVPVLGATAPAGAGPIPFDSGSWVLANADVVEHLGRQALSGSAYLPGIDFENGVIEFDLALDGSRGYPGITFRAVSPARFEHIYLRPHAGLRHDGLQYAPAFNGASDWQLYNGDGYTASLDMPRDTWVHVRVEVAGRRARVFYGDAAEPALVIDELKLPPAAGAVGIRSARNSSAYFADFSVVETDDLDLGPEKRPLWPRGLFTEWEVSQPFKAADVDGSRYPDADLRARLVWTKVATEPSGLLNLSRYVQRSGNGEADVVFARLVLEADAPEVRRISFGYSDAVTVYLDGRPLFSGNSSYLSRSPDYAGIISLEDALHLPLQAGRNELLMAVTESFGGWGVIAQDNDDDFLGPGLSESWRLEEGNRLPESVVWDPQRGLFYVSQYFRGGDEYVARVDPDGTVRDERWVAGLSRPTGMVLRGDRLLVVERGGLAEIDPEQGEITARRPIPGAGYLNDVALDRAGNAYVTDTRAGCIHRLPADGGAAEVWLEGDEVGEPNGILVDGDRLLWGNSGDARLKAADLGTREVSEVARFGDGANLDGLCPDGRGGWLVSDFAGRLYRVTAAGETTLVLDTTSSGAHCADLAYVPERALLVVPGLFDNRLTGYRCEGF